MTCVPPRRVARRGFTLLEVLLAIFVLGIGIISIGAVFPAGIVLQKQTRDDAIGPIVADFALAVIRTKVAPDDFGYAEDFENFPLGVLGLTPFEGTYGDLDPTAPRTLGDWGWRRPSLCLQEFGCGTNYPAFGGTDPLVQQGSTILFNTFGRPTGAQPNVNVTLSEIPWNRRVFGPAADDGQPGEFPVIVFEPWERSYPSFAPGTLESQQNPPDYHWDCMFRRHQGRMQVAIFVYSVAGTEQRGPYHVSETQNLLGQRIGIPRRLDLGNAWSVEPTGNVDPTVIPGTNPNTTLDIDNPDFHWQLPRQWLLDPNGNIHRLGAGRRVRADGPVRLMTPLPRLPDPTDNPLRSMRSFYFMGDTPGDVGTFWYLPIETTAGYRITPVYVAVKDL